MSFLSDLGVKKLISDSDRWSDQLLSIANCNHWKGMAHYADARLTSGKLCCEREDKADRCNHWACYVCIL